MSQYRAERVTDGPRPWAVVHYYEGTDGALSTGVGVVADDFETEQDAQEIADGLHRASAQSDRVVARAAGPDHDDPDSIEFERARRAIGEPSTPTTGDVFAQLPAEVRDTLTRALRDAACYRDPDDPDCVDCDEGPGRCEDHEGDAAACDSYQALLDALTPKPEPAPAPSHVDVPDGWTWHPCSDGIECCDGAVYPPDGASVRTTALVHDCREVGGEVLHDLAAGTPLVVRGHVVEWSDVHCETRDGRHVWVDPRNLAPLDARPVHIGPVSYGGDPDHTHDAECADD